MKSKLILILAMAVITTVAAKLYAAAVDSEEGVVRNSSNSRFSVTGVGNLSPTFTTTASITNAVLAAPGIVGKVVFFPTAINDTLKLYNATSGAGATPATLLFETAAPSPTMGNSSTLPSIGQAVVYDLMPGWTFTTGITAISTRTSTSTLNHSYISWDNPQ